MTTPKASGMPRKIPHQANARATAATKAVPGRRADGSHRCVDDYDSGQESATGLVSAPSVSLDSTAEAGESPAGSDASENALARTDHVLGNGGTKGQLAIVRHFEPPPPHESAELLRRVYERVFDAALLERLTPGAKEPTIELGELKKERSDEGSQIR